MEVPWEDPRSTGADNVSRATLGRRASDRHQIIRTVIDSLSTETSYLRRPLRPAPPRSVQFRTEIGSSSHPAQQKHPNRRDARPRRPRSASPPAQRVRGPSALSNRPFGRMDRRTPRRSDEHPSSRARPTGGRNRFERRRTRLGVARGHDLPTRPPVLGRLRVPHDGRLPHRHVPHRRRHRPAHHHRGPRRGGPHVLGNHRLHDRPDAGHARHRQARRRRRPQAPLPDRHRSVHRRLGAVRLRAVHAVLRGCALRAGPGWRRPHDLLPGDHR